MLFDYAHEMRCESTKQPEAIILRLSQASASQDRGLPGPNPLQGVLT